MRMFYLHASTLHHTLVVNKRHVKDKFQLNSLSTKGIKEIIEKIFYISSF